MKSRSCLAVLLWMGLLPLSAQINSAFIAHLSSHNLQQEHRAYINSLKSTPDSVHYYEANYYLKYFNDSLFLYHFKRATTLCLSDSNMLKKADLLFFKLNTASTKVWYALQETNSYGNRAALTEAYKASLFPKKYNTKYFPEELQKPFGAYKKYATKKPIAAALLSIAVPGAGKWYAGKGKSFLMAFMLNASYAVQSIESYNKLGLKHPFTLVNIGAFGLFYVSNIYGSYKAILDQRKETKKHWLIEASNYYN